MKRSELLEEIKDALQREQPIDESMQLSDIEEWDSLSTLAIISLYDRLFSKALKFNEINKVKTVSDLVNLASDKLE